MSKKTIITIIISLFFARSLLSAMEPLASENDNKETTRNRNKIALVFDFDDTIFPTSNLELIKNFEQCPLNKTHSTDKNNDAKQGDCKDSSDESCTTDSSTTDNSTEGDSEKFQKICSHFLDRTWKIISETIKIFEWFQGSADIYIISNASEEWLSIAQSIIDSTHPHEQNSSFFSDLVTSHGIRFISARDEYDGENMHDAKFHVFRRYLNSYETVISVGDLFYEWWAMDNLTSVTNKLRIGFLYRDSDRGVLTSQVNFLESLQPTIESFIEEIKLQDNSANSSQNFDQRILFLNYDPALFTPKLLSPKEQILQLYYNHELKAFDFMNDQLFHWQKKPFHNHFITRYQNDFFYYLENPWAVDIIDSEQDFRDLEIIFNASETKLGELTKELTSIYTLKDAYDQFIKGLLAIFVPIF